MGTNNTPYAILVGVGTLYTAAASAAAPAVNATPDPAVWRDLGDTEGGVKAVKRRSLEFHYTDQKSGPVKATMNQEGLELETSLVNATLENLADLQGLTVTDTPPGSGTIGTRKIGFYVGDDVVERAFLYRGKSPYGNHPAQYYVPRGVFDGDIEQAHARSKKAPVPLKFVALEDPNAASEDERFGVWTAQDAAALA